MPLFYVPSVTTFKGQLSGFRGKYDAIALAFFVIWSSLDSGVPFHCCGTSKL